MLLDCVLTSCNLNKLYLDFIPYFIKSWKILYPEIDVKIILISSYIPDEYKEYSDNIICYSHPDENISTSFISQIIRIFYPCLLRNYKNGIVISDIDMIPMNSIYFTKNIEKYTDDKFIYLRNVLFEYNEIAMCYNVATSDCWGDIMKIQNIEDIHSRIKDVNDSINYVDGHNQSGWNTDQLYLYNRIFDWDKKSGKFVFLKDDETKFNRLDRFTFNLNDSSLIEKIKNGEYTDYHCLRPFKTFERENNQILNYLSEITNYT